MTSKDKQSRYEEMSAGQELVESQLTKRLHEGESVAGQADMSQLRPAPSPF